MLAANKGNFRTLTNDNPHLRSLVKPDPIHSIFRIPAVAQGDSDEPDNLLEPLCRFEKLLPYPYISNPQRWEGSWFRTIIFVSITTCRRENYVKLCLYNFDPLKPHFYIVILEFTWVYIIIFFFYFCWKKNVNCGYTLEPHRRGDSNVYPQLSFEQKYEKYQNFYMKIFLFFLCV